MGRIAKLLSFVRTTRNNAKVTDVKIDSGGGPNITAEHFAPPGDDSFPLETDYVITEPVPRNGGEVIIGYIDPINTPKANKGDKRIYARDSDGAPMVEWWLKNDGSAILDNGSGSIELQSNGDVVINGVTIAANGDVTIPNSLNLNSKEIAEHDHPAGTPPGDTGVNN